MEDITLHRQNNAIKLERFMDKNCIKKDFLIVFTFVVLFLLIAIYEKNLFLPRDGLGLMEHINIWFFLIINIIIPIAINRSFKILEKNIERNTLKKFKEKFKNNANLKLVTILLQFSIAVGFCCFIGNSLQNANLINQLSFDFWDSINYKISYIVSRFYKLYLFAYFIPEVLIYVFILIKSISELLTISENDMKKYPIRNYAQLNILCNFGLNILIIILVPFVILSSSVFFIHNRFDITTISTINISAVSTSVYLGMYILLIKRYYVDIAEYKKNHINKINQKLSEIHQYIMDCQFNKKNTENLQNCLQQEEYLWKTRERIEQLTKFPLIVKAIFTGMSPFIPVLLKSIVSTIKTLF